jgi:hypothetical protein
MLKSGSKPTAPSKSASSIKASRRLAPSRSASVRSAPSFAGLCPFAVELFGHSVQGAPYAHVPVELVGRKRLGTLPFGLVYTFLAQLWDREQLHAVLLFFLPHVS